MDFSLLYNQVNTYLVFHDVLTSSGPGSDYVTINFRTNLISCQLTIQEFHRKTNRAFDLDFVRENGNISRNIFSNASHSIVYLDQD